MLLSTSNRRPGSRLLNPSPPPITSVAPPLDAAAVAAAGRGACAGRWAAPGGGASLGAGRARLGGGGAAPPPGAPGRPPPPAAGPPLGLGNVVPSAHPARTSVEGYERLRVRAGWHRPGAGRALTPPPGRPSPPGRPPYAGRARRATPGP